MIQEQEEISVMKPNPFNKEQRKLAKAILYNTQELDLIEDKLIHFEVRMKNAETKIQDLADEHFYMKKDMSRKDKLKAVAIVLGVFISVGITTGVLPESFMLILHLFS